MLRRVPSQTFKVNLSSWKKSCAHHNFPGEGHRAAIYGGGNGRILSNWALPRDAGRCFVVLWRAQSKVCSAEALLHPKGQSQKAGPISTKNVEIRMGTPILIYNTSTFTNDSTWA